jgi:hypothetical protein
MRDIYLWGIFVNLMILAAIFTSGPLHIFLLIGACAAIGVKAGIIIEKLYKRLSNNKYQTEDFCLHGQIKIMGDHFCNFDLEIPGLLFDQKPTKQDYIRAIDKIIEHWFLSKVSVSWDLLKKENIDEKSGNTPSD